ncbi:sigma-70 family RNA polymerase sigma factor [bacterium]|nr:sigma-70 family RNA polymerase sigma factor [candidate division CSSED10-310 bacterium]
MDQNEVSISGTLLCLDRIQAVMEAMKNKDRSSIIRRPELKDAQLMELLCDGDQHAFTILLNRHQDKLVNYLHRLCGNYETACDLAQETFLRVFTKSNKYKPTHAFSTWLYRIGTNLAINHLRRRKLVRFFSVEEEQPGTDGLTYGQRLRSDDPAPDDLLTRREDVQQVQVVLSALPLKYRVPLTLREIEELDYQEIGQIMGLSSGTVKSRIFRGREEFRKRLQRLRLRENNRMERTNGRNSDAL